VYAFEVETLDRRDVRCPVQATGRVRIGWGKWISCEIRDISRGGARIAVAEGVVLPEQFLLTSSLYEGKRVCLRRWECGSETGVEFI
jgi:hypothetical protein